MPPQEPTATSPDALTDDVIELAVAGEETAIAMVWRALNPGVLRYLRSLGAGDPDDVASVVWMELAQAFDRIDPPTVDGLRRLLFTIARRRVIDDLRRRSARPTLVDIDSAEPIPEGPEKVLADALEYLRDLPTAQAEVIALRVIVGMSAEEVGELTGQTPGAVRVMSHRALATLRDRLEGHMDPTAQSVPADVTSDTFQANNRTQ